MVAQAEAHQGPGACLWPQKVGQGHVQQDPLGTSFPGMETVNHSACALSKNTVKFHLSILFSWKFCLYKIKVTGENNFQPTYESFVDVP